MAVCYRHPGRETGVSCSSCGRPICPDCMTPTPVGMRCPECSRDRTRVKTARTIRRSTTPVVTRALVALNVLVFVAETATGAPLGGGGGGSVYLHGFLGGPLVTDLHQYYRLLTYGFLHDGILHIAFNMWFLWVIGMMLEPAIGRLNFAVIYFASLLGGATGALLFAPDVATIGASGALFGLLGAMMVVAYYRGVSIWRSGLGLTLVINIAFSLTIPGISIGGHVGGFVAGVICGWLVVQVGERRNMPALAIAGCAAVAVASVAGAIALGNSAGLFPHGIAF